jgi:hypothetical protein
VDPCLFIYLFIYLFLVGPGFELRASSTPPVHFALVILEMQSRELLAQAGLNPRSS